MTRGPVSTFAVLLTHAACVSYFCGIARGDDAPPRTVEEILVTAQKKEEVIQEVPISMAAFTGEFLKETGVTTFHELIRFTPNVHFAEESPCCAPIFIRGFGSPFVAGSFDPTVTFVLDELSIPKDIYLVDPLYDIERFEVLRGPQGILFGKNTPAGLINVTTGKPSPEVSGYVLGRLGNLGVHRAEAAIGGPLGAWGEVAQFRLAAVNAGLPEDVHNTKRDEDEPDASQRAARLRLAFFPLEGLDVLVTGSLSNVQGKRTFSFQQRDLKPSSVEFIKRFDPEFEDDGFNHQNSQDLPADIERRTDVVSGNFRYALGTIGPLRDIEIVSVVGRTGFDMVAPVDNDFSPADVLNVDARFWYRQNSAEFRGSATVPGPFLGDIEVLLGTLWFENSFENDLSLTVGDDFEEWLTSPPGIEIGTGMAPPGGIGLPGIPGFPSPIPPVLSGDGFRLVSDQTTSSQGVFGQAAWHLTEQWTVSFGARFNFEKKTALLDMNCLEPGVVCGALGISNFLLDLDREESDFSPKFTLQYFPFENLSLFATRAEGAKSGGFNNLLTTTRGIEVEPEETTSWETGAKGTLLDGTLSYAATFFNMDVKNLQVQQFLGGATVVVRNAGAARSRGVEADFQWFTPWEPLSLRAAGSFTDARFKEFTNAPATRSSGELEQDLSGRQMPFVSKWQLALSPELRFPLSARGVPWLEEWLPDDLGFATGPDVFWRDDTYLDVDLDPGTLQDAYWLVNYRFRIFALGEALTFGATVENVMDTDALQLATDSSAYPGYMGVQEFQRRFAFETRYAW